MSWQPKRKFAVVVMRGKRHQPFPTPDWRTWDWIEIFYRHADATLRDQDAALVEDDRKLRKLGAVASAVKKGAPLLQYDAVCLVDEDIAPGNGCTWDDVFELFAETGHDIGHPAVTVESDTGHTIMCSESEIKWRRTNWMDLQAILMTRVALAANLQLFTESVFGWGFEQIWGTREKGVVLLDATPVFHPRRRAQGDCYKGEVVAAQEAVEFRKRKGLVAYDHKTLERHRLAAAKTA